MSVILTYIIIEGVLIFLLNKKKHTELEILKKWKTGKLAYEEILALRTYKDYFLNKLDKEIKIGKNPGPCKKES